MFILKKMPRKISKRYRVKFVKHKSNLSNTKTLYGVRYYHWDAVNIFLPLIISPCRAQCNRSWKYKSLKIAGSFALCGQSTSSVHVFLIWNLSPIRQLDTWGEGAGQLGSDLYLAAEKNRPGGQLCTPCVFNTKTVKHLFAVNREY